MQTPLQLERVSTEPPLFTGKKKDSAVSTARIKDG